MNRFFPFLDLCWGKHGARLDVLKKSWESRVHEPLEVLGTTSCRQWARSMIRRLSIRTRAEKPWWKDSFQRHVGNDGNDDRMEGLWLYFKYNAPSWTYIVSYISSEHHIQYKYYLNTILLAYGSCEGICFCWWRSAFGWIRGQLMAGQGIGIGAQRCESHGLLACPWELLQKGFDSKDGRTASFWYALLKTRGAK